MYYVIAATSPQNLQDEGQIMNQIRQHTPLLQEQNRDPRQQSTIHLFNVEKSQFKIGSLDLLMQLNESTARIDGQLDVLCKKIEKIEQDTRGDQEQHNLTYKVNYAGPGTPYSTYIREFKWESLKYPTKRTLNENVITIQKQMHQKEEQIRKNMDEYNNMKQRIQSMTKKDTGNLQQRDFTDDIYNKHATAERFVEHHGSESFANLLIVVNNEKLEAFRQQLPTLMEKYYEVLDNNERRRIREQARNRFQDILKDHKKYVQAKELLEEEQKNAAEEEKKQITEEKQTEQMAKLEEGEARYTAMIEQKRPVSLNDLEPKEREQAQNDDEFMQFLECEDYLCSEGYKVVEENTLKRMPCALAPLLNPIGIDDRDGNVVYQTIVYKPQSDDVIKACRKAGVTAKTFVYDRQAWDAERIELSTLKDQQENKRKHLNQVSTDLFQESIVALMHLKVIRAFIEGVLRFGLEQKFMLGLVCPKKGAERQILTQMNTVLAEDHLREYYGEKMDAQEQDDYWPFVCIPLTSPLHVFDQAAQ